MQYGVAKIIILELLNRTLFIYALLGFTHFLVQILKFIIKYLVFSNKVRTFAVLQ